MRCELTLDVGSSSLLASPALRGAAELLQWSADGQCLKDDQEALWQAIMRALSIAVCIPRFFVVAK